MCKDRAVTLQDGHKDKVKAPEILYSCMFITRVAMAWQTAVVVLFFFRERISQTL